ncbi:MAG: general stress protein [Oscillochloridaceae bacterium umkhey_bin13]
MTQTIIGLFDTRSDAEYVVRALHDQGFSTDAISLVHRDEQGVSKTNADDSVAEHAGSGAVGGTVLGGALGFLVGAGLLTIPGVGPVLAAGPIAAALGSSALGAGIGAATGGLAGSLVGMGVPEDDANYYAEGVRRGGALVTVTAVDTTMAGQATELMRRHGAVDIQQRGAGWREDGWTHFNPDAQPYPHTYNADRPANYDPLSGRPDFARGQREGSTEEERVTMARDRR